MLTNGFISRSGQLVPVIVWGTDQGIERGKAKVNPSMAKEFSISDGDIVLRLPATGLIPSGSLFVTENYTTSLRLAYDGIIAPEEGGNLSLKNEQIIPLNIFVNRAELAEMMETEGRINLILSGRLLSPEEVEQAWTPELSGLKTQRYEDFTEITSDRVFLQQEVTDQLRDDNPESNRLFSYLVNSIEKDGKSVPYSFATAVDRYKDITLADDELILSDYTAKRIDARTGDLLRLTYFTSADLKTLFTDTVELKVRAIVPLAELLEDETLSADFPGLTDVDRCTDWDSDIPIDMDLITAEDERYWELYKSTPKAILPYAAVAPGWSNSYGSATGLRIAPGEANLHGLQSPMFGIQLVHPREAGLFAAMNGVDFSGLFLALGFFIIISAILLMLVPLKEMLYVRRHEIDLLRAVGYSGKRIVGNLWMESAPVVLVSALAGVITGLIYTFLIIWLLGTVWKGATHTGGFSIYPNMATIMTGLLAGIIISLAALRISLVRALNKPADGMTPGRPSVRKKFFRMIICIIVTVQVVLLNYMVLQSVVLFILTGVLFTLTAAVCGDYLITRYGAGTREKFTTAKMVWGTLYARKKQATLSFFTLASGIFIVFSVGLNRQGFADGSQLLSGTGGFTLWGESSVPLYHNLSTEAGRERMSLTGLPAGTEVLQLLRYGADEASCLNLNKVLTPTVLGVDMDALKSSRFGIKRNVYGLERDSFFERMKQTDEGVYPALVDETVLMWSLGMSLGDTIHYEGSNGKKAVIQLAGILDNTIFQGNILTDRSLFSEIWDGITGSEVMLVRVQEREQEEEVKTLLSQALHEYGIRLTTTADRLKQFNSVTDTYLTIFMTLGGIGLLLGIMSFIIVVRKNLTMRRREIDLYRTIGFADDRIEEILYRENLSVPLYAVITGVVSALAGVSGGFTHIGLWIWVMAFVFTLIFITCIVLFVKREVRQSLHRTK